MIRDTYETLQYCAENDDYIGVLMFTFALLALVALSPLYVVAVLVGWVIARVVEKVEGLHQ